MGRRSLVCPKNCAKHQFSLKPVHFSAIISRRIAVTYCQTRKGPENLLPVFNRDGMHKTPAFVLKQVSERRLRSKDSLEHLEGRNQDQILMPVAETQSKFEEIFVPKPRLKNSYCYVCKLAYEDYLEHIKSLEHRSFIAANGFEKYIQELCVTTGRSQPQSSPKVFFQTTCPTLSHFSLVCSSSSQHPESLDQLVKMRAVSCEDLTKGSIDKSMLTSQDNMIL